MCEAGARRSLPLCEVHADSVFGNACEAKFLISLLASIWDLTKVQNLTFKTVGEIVHTKQHREQWKCNINSAGAKAAQENLALKQRGFTSLNNVYFSDQPNWEVCLPRRQWLHPRHFLQRLGGLSLLSPPPAPSPRTGERCLVTDTGKDVALAAVAPVGHDSTEGLILLAAFSTLTCQRNEGEKGKKSLIIT